MASDVRHWWRGPDVAVPVARVQYLAIDFAEDTKLWVLRAIFPGGDWAVLDRFETKEQAQADVRRRIEQLADVG